jgi:hypothetical protein
MIEKLRNSVENFNQEISKEFYLQGAGLKDDIKLDEIYNKYPEIKNEDNINIIKQAIIENEYNPEEKRKLILFLENIYNEVISSELSSLSEEILLKEASGTIEINGRVVHYRSSLIEMLNQDNRSAREEIRIKRNEFIDKELNPVHLKIYESERDLIKGFGYNNMIDMFHSLSGIDLYKLNESLQQFLKISEDMYVDVLSYFARNKLNLKISELKKHDLLYILRGKEFDRFFPQKDLLPRMSNFISQMGVDISAGNNIKFDLERREKKSPRAFCSPVKIPDEVYLVIYPRGGEDDYTAFLHELGHALHFANIKYDIGLEYKWFGDNTVTEGYAMSLDHLTMNPIWMKKVLDVDINDAKDYFIHRNFFELMMLRRYAGKLDYEIKLHKSSSLNGMEELYSKILTDSTKVQYSGKSYLDDVDGYFYVARYLRAWMFQANLHECMRNKFNEDWFVNPRAGKFLTELWGLGQKFRAEELLEMNNCPGLSMKPVYEEIHNALSN